MKAIFKSFVILALLHFFFIIGFVGWMFGTGRIDERRLADLRTMVTETIADRDKREAEEQAAIEVALREQEAAENQAIPLTSDDRITRKLIASEADQQNVQRMRREIQDLQRTLQIERRQLDEERSEFLAEKDSFEAARERIRETEGSEQFQSALTTLAAMKKDQAHSLLNETLTVDPNGFEKVIAYLDNLEDRQRAEILGVFEEEDPALAARLLELLRTRGVVATAAGN
ncbi:MAG: hypothetical protein ED559_04465 [Phycisphaera sp.]|nr:MAG: hypothetical protein ED559_04465 [Phycisphaera sp.]